MSTSANPVRYLRSLGAAAIATSLLALSACSGSALGGDDSSGSEGPVKIGLLVPQSGVYKSLGDDMKAGFEVYLEQNDNQLGGREVEVILADEGESPDTGKAAAQKLLEQDQVAAVTGVVSSLTMNAIADEFAAAQIPLVSSNASPVGLVKDFVWRTSYENDEPGKALGTYVSGLGGGSTYLIAADYQAGKDETGGFKSTYEPAGGVIAGEGYTPFPGTTNFQPYLANITASGATNVFSFYAGGAAVDFVKQYAQFGLAGTVKHYSAGFLTEGSVLEAQGESALGTFTAMNYAPDIDNEINKKFVEDYEAKTGLQPTTYAMASYDAAKVLDMAIEEAGTDSAEIDKQIAELGEIESPRGTWEFNDTKTPKQMWYLREVQMVDGKLVNAIVEELGEQG
ncbi:ABC transporter substrate-binding protein [Epidermidibacterium keratini]|uniref:ABC transporter substrate-binding protein n=1 Tax=Epidermidibacterium keratini TaxID=1891644 RepID=A0A7L4YJE9_9ACTN|nr:ABC transporter substrate-binding protein [Epidermidibacterium keratini]QHB99375.1 ABC transporter substrate-binding protein [Epidermidibacterium keratini]